MPVADVGVAPGDEIAAGGEEALPERLTLAPECAVGGQHVRVQDDPGSFLGRDVDRLVGRCRVDDDQLVDERVALHELASRTSHDGTDGRRLIERRQDEADGQPLPLLERRQSPDVRELLVREVRLGEPAIDPRWDAAGGGRRALGSLECLGLRGPPIEDRTRRRLPGLDHDDGRPCLLDDHLRERAEETAFWRQRQGTGARGQGRGAHDHEAGPIGLVDEGGRDAAALDERRLRAPVRVQPDECGQRPFRLGADDRIDARGHDVEGFDFGTQTAAQGVREAEGQLGMRAAAYRDQDPADVIDAALLDHRDVARRLADDLVDGWAEDRVDRPRPGALPSRRWRWSAPAEKDQVGLLLGRRLEDALCGSSPDAHGGPQLDVIRCELLDALQQASCLASAGRSLGERRSFRHLDDAQRGEHAAMLHERGADAHEVGRRARVGEGQQDAGRQPAPTPAHVPAALVERPAAFGDRPAAFDGRPAASGGCPAAGSRQAATSSGLRAS